MLSFLKYNLKFDRKNKKFPISKPYLTKSCRSNFIDSFDSSWISSLGKYIKQFENLFSEYIGIKYCLATSNGTTALELAIASLDLPENSEIIIPDLTFAAVSNAVISRGHVPITVDISSNDWNLTLESITQAKTSLTKVIILVHSYGYPCRDIEKIRRYSKENNIWLIEDCAEAHGATFNKKKVGSFGDLSCFSFYGNKIITSGEGGAVLTKKKNLYITMKKLRDHGMSDKIRYFHEISGFNFRMTNPQASILVSQLRNIDKFLAIRKKQEEIYDKRLIELGFSRPKVRKNIHSVNWIYTVLCPKEINPKKLASYLSEKGIETRPIFRPINTFPYIKKKKINKTSIDVSNRGISLPTYIGLKKNDIEYICRCIENFIKNK